MNLAIQGSNLDEWGGVREGMGGKESCTTIAPRNPSAEGG